MPQAIMTIKVLTASGIWCSTQVPSFKRRSERRNAKAAGRRRHAARRLDIPLFKIDVKGPPDQLSRAQIIPAATVLLLASSITMKLPVAWLRG